MLVALTTATELEELLEAVEVQQQQQQQQPGEEPPPQEGPPDLLLPILCFEPTIRPQHKEENS